MFRMIQDVKRFLVNAGFLAVEVFTADRRDGFHRAVILLLVCSLFSLLLSSLLLLYLLFNLDYKAAVAGGIAGCFGTLLTVALFSSKRVRCLATLFVISVFIKKSRNLLLTAGTSLVVLKNVRNTLENLAGLAGSVICSLKAKKASIVAPFSSYVTMLKWIGEMLQTDLTVARLNSQLTVLPRLGSDRFREKLAEAERKLNETVAYMESVTTTASSVAGRLFPAVSLLVLMAFMALHVKRYSDDMKYKNRFITSKFVGFDEKQKAEGKPSVLPLTPEEQRLYTSRPPGVDGKAVLRFVRPVACCFVEWLVIITVDALLYHFVNMVTTELSELEPFHVPLLVSITEISSLAGIPLAGGNHEKGFSYSVTLFEKECLPRPKLLLHDSLCPLAAILLALLVMAFTAGRMSRLRLLVCEHFFPDATERRAEFLHAQILRNRLDSRREKQRRSIKAQIVKPDFWCPLLFQPKEPPQSIV